MTKKLLLFLVILIGVIYIISHAFSGGKKAPAVNSYAGQSDNVLQQAGSMENSALAARAAAQGSIKDFNRIANGIDPESDQATQKRFN